MAEGAAQRGQPVGGVTLDATGGDAQVGGCLLDREAPEVPQHHALALPSAERTQRRPEDVALLDAGLPEPRLQAQLVSPAGERTDADMVVERSRVALHYDGGHHRTPEQQARDARRERYCLERAWLPVRVTAADRREGFRSVAETVRRRRESL